MLPSCPSQLWQTSSTPAGVARKRGLMFPPVHSQDLWCFPERQATSISHSLSLPTQRFSCASVLHSTGQIQCNYGGKVCDFLSLPSSHSVGGGSKWCCRLKHYGPECLRWRFNTWVCKLRRLEATAITQCTTLLLKEGVIPRDVSHCPCPKVLKNASEILPTERAMT